MCYSDSYNLSFVDTNEELVLLSFLHKDIKFIKGLSFDEVNISRGIDYEDKIKIEDYFSGKSVINYI
jgi:hypothetical protein